MISTRTFGDITLHVMAIAPCLGSSRREAERAAIHELAVHAFGSPIEIRHTADGVPFINGSTASISISHSDGFACLASSQGNIVGVDVEQPRIQLRRVAPRILSESELAVYGQSDILLLRAWTMKEALYKAALTPGLDFRRDIRLPLDMSTGKAQVCGRSFAIVAIDESDERTITLVSAGGAK